MAEQIAAAQPCGAIHISEVIEQIIARDNLERPVSPIAQTPTLPTQQREGQVDWTLTCRHFTVA